MTNFEAREKVTHPGFPGILTVIAVHEKLAWVETAGGRPVVVELAALVPFPNPAAPTEPGWYLSNGDEMFFLSETGNWYFDSREVSAPNGIVLKQMIEEGSEREAAIREVVDWLDDKTAGQIRNAIEARFLSGVDQ